MSEPTADVARRVLVVDDQRAFAQSLEVVVDSQSDLACLGSASTGEEALDWVERDTPSVILMDIDLPGIDGIEATRQILERHADISVVMLTGVPDATLLARAASVGAGAFLLKSSSVDEILDAVRTGSRTGHLDVDAAAIGRLLDDEGAASTIASQVTQREFEVLGELAQGRQPKEIARSLGISVHTCRGYVKNLLAKLGAHSALEAVVTAHRIGLISLGTDRDQPS